MKTFEIIVGVAMVYIAFQQHLTNRRLRLREIQIAKRKIDLELYDKRYRIYHETWLFVSEVNAKGAIEEDKVWLFSNNTNKCEFLFGHEIVDFVKQIIQNTNKINDCVQDLKRLDNNNPLKKNSQQERSEILNWFRKLDYITPFKKYLNFNELT